tara:strand:+ start:1626 stop:2330 length:705 start_codon:yes stop_codon:yes gene_type:complete
MQYLYTLVFDAEPHPVVFYVGRTNDPERRLKEHRLAVKNLEHTEYKYQWARQLEAIGLTWDLVVIDEIDDDEDSEYAWVLRFARDNQSRSISFIDDLPLTNMKAGDFITEMIKIPSINTAQDIREYRNAQAVRAITYERNGGGTGEYTAQGAKHIEEAHRIAEQLAANDLHPKTKKITRTSNPMNEESVRKANSLLLKRELDEGTMLWEEYHQEMLRIGYPEWTETKPQLLNKR